MPHKFNAGRRDKIPKQKHQVTNWAEYNEGLRQRGDVTSGSVKTRLAGGQHRVERRVVDSRATRIWRLSFA